MNVNIEIIGNSEKEIIMLHGWGQDSTTFNNIVTSLKGQYKIYLIDLPGFGKSDEPDHDYDLNDYAKILNQVISSYHIKKPLVIGHSFGGRLAIKYEATYGGLNKIILVNSAGIKPKRNCMYYFKVYYYKFIKRVFSLPLFNKYKKSVLNKFGSNDYKNATIRMRKVLVKVVNEDLSHYMRKIKIPVLLFWGENDKVTPISNAYKMKELLKDSGLVVVKNSGHFSYLDDPYLLIEVIKVFY